MQAYKHTYLNADMQTYLHLHMRTHVDEYAYMHDSSRCSTTTNILPMLPAGQPLYFLWESSAWPELSHLRCSSCQSYCCLVCFAHWTDGFFTDFVVCTPFQGRFIAPLQYYHFRTAQGDMERNQYTAPSMDNCLETAPSHGQSERRKPNFLEYTIRMDTP